MHIQFNNFYTLKCINKKNKTKQIFSRSKAHAVVIPFIKKKSSHCSQVNKHQNIKTKHIKHIRKCVLFQGQQVIGVNEFWTDEWQCLRERNKKRTDNFQRQQNMCISYRLQNSLKPPKTTKKLQHYFILWRIYTTSRRVRYSTDD